MPTLGEPEVIALLGREALTIAFDTNAIFQTRRREEQDKDPFVRVCNHVIKINKLRGAPQDRPYIRKVISASVYVEKLHDLRQQFSGYDHGKIMGFLQSKGIDLVSFEPRHAEHVAALLGRLYPDDDAWQGFKKQRCASCLGLPRVPDSAMGQHKKRCGATIDWLVAGHADAEGMLLVTDDSREEFKEVELKTSLKTLEAAVEKVCVQLDQARAARST